MELQSQEKTFNEDLKQNQKRLFKTLSIINYFTLNSTIYNQKIILNRLNLFLFNESLKTISLKTLRKDLTFLVKKGIIKKFLLRLGEYKGTFVRYSLTKYSYRNLRRELKSKNEIYEKDIVNKFYFKKEQTEKFFAKKEGIKKGSGYINKINNIYKYKNNEDNKEIDIVSHSIVKLKYKKMKYLDKIKENQLKEKHIKNKERIEKLKNNRVNLDLKE